MNAALTASTSAILAIDLGKYKSVACFHDPNSGEFRFTTFDTSREEMTKLLPKQTPAVVIIEACLLAGWVDGRPRLIFGFRRSRLRNRDNQG